MTNGLAEIIKQLEQQGRAIERALAALREVGESGGAGSSTSAAPAGSGKRRGRPRKGSGMTPEGRRRLSEALKARWAARRAGSDGAPATVKSTAKPKAKRKGGMTPEGRKRLSEALRKRWAARKAAGGVPVKKAAKKA
jgi:hypothetical protein